MLPLYRNQHVYKLQKVGQHMKYVRYSYNDKIQYGILEGNQIFELTGGIYTSFQKTGLALPLTQVKLLSPCNPSKIVCIGLNYRDHAEECNIPLPKSPVVFIKPSSSVIGPLDNIIYPEMSQRVDYEAELGVVIKHKAKKVPVSNAMEYVLGFTCANDVTARDLQPSDGQWTVAKSFDTFLPLGPVITDEVDCNNLNIESRLNGKVMQNSNTSNLIFKVDYLISYLSGIMTLYPGDVIITGTPAGIAPMNPGDVIEVEIENIGVLRNTIVKA